MFVFLDKKLFEITISLQIYIKKSVEQEIWGN